MSLAAPASTALSERPHWLAGPLVAGVRLICGAGARWVEEPGQPTAGRQRIFFANHTSHLDPVVVWSSLPAVWRLVTRPVAARDYWQKGAVRRFLALRVFNAVLISRAAGAGAPGDRIAQARHVIDETLAEMGAAYSLILFPEGTRGSAEEPARFKSGLYHLAKARPEIELVPVYLENLGRILPKGEFLPVPLLATATFGRALHLGADETREAFLERTRAAVVALRQEQMK